MNDKLDPLTGDILPQSGATKSPPALDAPSSIPITDPDALANLSRADLEHHYRIACGAFLGVALASKEDIAEAFKLKLAAKGLNEADMFKALPVMQAWFDRTLGKAPQSIAMTVDDKGLGRLSTEKLLRLERELARMTGQESILISPMPAKLLD